MAKINVEITLKKVRFFVAGYKKMCNFVAVFDY